MAWRTNSVAGEAERWKKTHGSAEKKQTWKLDRRGSARAPVNRVKKLPAGVGHGELMPVACPALNVPCGVRAVGGGDAGLGWRGGGWAGGTLAAAAVPNRTASGAHKAALCLIKDDFQYVFSFSSHPAVPGLRLRQARLCGINT